MLLPDTCRLYGILDFGYIAPAEAESFARRMIEGGVGILQVRAKKLPQKEIVRIARAVKPITADAGVPLILNDHAHLVDEAEADGVHVGQDDLSVSSASGSSRRRILVGKSTHSVEQAVAAAAEKPDYIAFGPLYSTPTKPDYVPIGLKDIRKVHKQVKLPVFCIGGVKLENLDEVIAAGARRVVIVSGILKAGDVRSYCAAVVSKLKT